MKIYRVAADFYDPYFLRNFGHKHSFESIYYKLGYTPFHGEIERGFVNNIGERMQEEGKYFFLFPEAAYKCARDIVCHQFPEIYSWTSKILEYDFPIETVFDLIGYGVYHFADWQEIETNIPKSKFCGERVMSNTMEEEYKKEAFKMACNEIFEFLNSFRKMQNKALLNYDDFIQKVVNQDRFYDDFMNDNLELYKSPHLTGNYWNMCMIADERFLRTNLSGDTVKDLSENGLVLDFSHNAITKREEILCEIRKDNLNKAKRLLLNYNNRKR